LLARARLDVSWTMPGDDGLTGSVASYELRLRSCAIGAQCAITLSDFASATLADDLPALQPGGSHMQATVSELPLESHVEVAIRFVDEANNFALSTASIDTPHALQSIAGDAGEVDYGISMTSGHFSGSTKPNLVIGRPRQSNLGGGLRILSETLAATNITASQLGISSISARVGRAVANAGDVDGDGFDDLLVGAPGIADAACTNGTGAATGRAFLLFGGPTGVRGAASPVPCSPLGSADCYVAILPPAGSGVCSFGQAVNGAGHLDGSLSSRPLFAIGAGDLTTTSSRIGKTFVYRLTGDRPDVTLELVTAINGDNDDYHFGAAVCGVGDVNGDGTADLLVGAHRRGRIPVVAGRAYVILGGGNFSGTGAALSVAGHASTTDGIVRLGDMVDSDSFGTSCDYAGDVNGDGLDDFVITAPGGLRNYVFKGRADFDARPSMAAPDATILSDPAWGQPGEVSAGEDFDGDGLDDVAVGDMQGVYVFRGDTTNVVSSSPLVVFPQSITVSTGYPVLLTGNLLDNLLGESSYPDLVIGKVAGPSVRIQY
jgi:hypothetical protein